MTTWRKHAWREYLSWSKKWRAQIDDPHFAGRRASSFSDLIGREVVSASCGAVSLD
jgi:hypothetical protein